MCWYHTTCRYTNPLRKVFCVKLFTPLPPPSPPPKHTLLLLLKRMQQFVKGDIQSMDLVSFVLQTEAIDTVLHFAAQVSD